jgi:uncharacterized protein (DUF58 family)
MSTASRLGAVRARLDLPRVRRAAGLLDGRHRSIYTGHGGQDFDDMAQYHPGDDVGDIDWKASARSGLPIIRRFVKESNLAMVLAVDTGRNMAAVAPSGERKADVAMFAADVVAYLARTRGDLVALVAGDAGRLTQVPARGGTSHMELLLRLLERDLTLAAPASDLGRVLDRTFSWLVRRSLVVVITDEARPGPEHEDALRRLRTRHEVMVIAVADTVPTDVAGADVADVDGGAPLPAFLRADRRLATEARAAAERRRSEVRAMLRRRGIEHVVAASSDDVVDALIDLFRRQRRVRR